MRLYDGHEPKFSTRNLPVAQATRFAWFDRLQRHSPGRHSAAGPTPVRDRTAAGLNCITRCRPKSTLRSKHGPRIKYID